MLNDTRSWEHIERMISVDSAREQITAAFSPLPAIELPLIDVFDLVLADSIIATDNIPPFCNSAMDGYAVRANDVRTASPANAVTLNVIAQLAAGYPADIEIKPGTAARIMTGAPIPNGADAVVRFEETDESDVGSHRSSIVQIRRAVEIGENVRYPGEDLQIGEIALAAGTRLNPPQIGILATLNQTSVLVHRRPKIAILSTGDEVAELGSPLRPGQIRNSNSYMLAAMVRQFGGEPYLAGIAHDTVKELSSLLHNCQNMDLIVTSGGVSVGDYDMVKNVLRAEGEISIWQVRMKPGKPLAFGRIGETPLLGLPGNPVAAAISFCQFGRAAIRKMLGRRDLEEPTICATLTERIENRGRRRQFVRAQIKPNTRGGYLARSAGEQGAGMLTSLARANGLLIIPEECSVGEPGMQFQVELLDWSLFSL